uniref:MAGE family member B18 n=1 Tax=Nannospalax galili TaxID=1026970 RepID=A0A8C6RBE7_NANGA
MPRGQKSKLRAREKRKQARSEHAGEESSSNYPFYGCPHQTPPGTPSFPKRPQGAQLSFLNTFLDGGACSKEDESSYSSENVEDWCKDHLNHKVVLLAISKADMLKSVTKSSKNDFIEILKRATDHMELAFGVDLKEVDPIKHVYALFNKLKHSLEGVMGEERMPNSGLLMIVLGVIFTKNKCVSETEIWEVLNMMGVYANRKHFIYGDPKKVITEDLMKLKYLEYYQVLNSNPPCYEFMWGSRAHAEISKM